MSKKGMKRNMLDDLGKHNSFFLLLFASLGLLPVEVATNCVTCTCFTQHPALLLSVMIDDVKEDKIVDTLKTRYLSDSIYVRLYCVWGREEH